MQGVSSPIARFSLAGPSNGPVSNSRRAPNSNSFVDGGSFVQRKSICEPIDESEEQLLDPSSATASSSSDLPATLEVYKRQHRPRPKVTRTQSAPQLISTQTTQPIYINQPG